MKEFFTRKGASVLVGGQFGSEAKGLAASYFMGQLESSDYGKDLLDTGLFYSTTNAGAQAGHTTILKDGTKFVCYHLPTIGVLHQDATIYLNAGSIIDPDLLRHEIISVTAALLRPMESVLRRLVIHPNACVITDAARVAEAGLGGATVGIGSTQKGVGAALANKIMRQPMATMGSRYGEQCTMVGGEANPISIRVLNLNREIQRGATVTVEMPQGTGLSLNASPFYPTVTSRDCWVGQGLADAAIHPYFLSTVAMVCRTMPIRVGHITDPGGKIIGNSGPFYPDSLELDWARDLPGIEAERTTVTKRVRRIATWSRNQYMDALRLNRPSIVIITFVNYLRSSAGLAQFSRALAVCHNTVGVHPEVLYSWGPRCDQVGTLAEAMDYMMNLEFPNAERPPAEQ